MQNKPAADFSGNREPLSRVPTDTSVIRIQLMSMARRTQVEAK